MPLLPTPKSRAPELDVPLVGGGNFNLHDQKPDAFTILVFYRGLHCPKCQDQLKDIDAQFSGLSDQGLNVIAVTMDDAARAEKAKADWGLKHLPIAYSLSILTAKEYGLFLSDARKGSDEPNIFAEPAIFVIKPDGAIYAEYVQNTPFGRPPIADIAAGLKFVVESGYPTRGTSVA